MDKFKTKIKNVLSEFLCTKEFSFEWIVYFIIILMLIAFFIVSCYNANRLIEFHEVDIDVKNGVNIAIECVIIFTGFFLGMIWKNNGISKLQLCFCFHVSLFLILTGISALIATSKRIEKSKSTV
jgi:hypothetical protein